MVKLYRTIKDLNKFLLKNNKTIKLKNGLICGFDNNLMAFDKRRKK